MFGLWHGVGGVVDYEAGEMLCMYCAQECMSARDFAAVINGDETAPERFQAILNGSEDLLDFGYDGTNPYLYRAQHCAACHEPLVDVTPDELPF